MQAVALGHFSIDLVVAFCGPTGLQERSSAVGIRRDKRNRGRKKGREKVDRAGRKSGAERAIIYAW